MPKFRSDSETGSNSIDTKANTTEESPTVDSFTETSDTESDGLDDNEGSDSDNFEKVEHVNDNNAGHAEQASDLITNSRRRKRAEMAKDLVKSQEKLVAMLQHMKNDLSRMDREATSIKEEVARSKQLFDVVVSRKKVHQLNFTTNGYNLSHAMPKVSYSTYRQYSETRKNFPHHHRGSLACPSSADSSRRSSWSGRQNSRPDHLKHTRLGRQEDQQYSVPSSQCVTSQSEISDSENEKEFERSRGLPFDLTGSRISVSGMSTESCMSDSSMSGASSRLRHRRMADYRTSQSQGRRSSYFFTPKPESPQQDLSDDVCL